MAKRKRKRAKKSRLGCAGVVSSGKKKGKLKKGFRWRKGGGCPIKVK